MHHNKQQDVHHLLPSRKAWRWVAAVRNNRVRVINPLVKAVMLRLSVLGTSVHT